jgi:F420-dependent oxidoreductase-like protein
MRLGLQVSNFTWLGGAARLGEDFANVARRADEAGMYSLWVMDHFFQIRGIGPADWDMLEGYSALSYAAGVTKKVKLGTMVTGVTYRYPGLLVKTVTTLDVLSGGRAYLGIGAAWNEEEHVGLGVPFPPLKERFERLEETLQIALQMWSDNQEPYNGKHNKLGRTLNVPQALSNPHPPILIGGGGEQKTLRLVAKYGDACNLFARMGDDVVKHKLAVLHGHCEELGRNYADIEKTTLGNYKLTKDGNGERETSPAQLLEELHHLAEMGIDQHIFSLQNVTEAAPFELIAQLVSEANKIVPAGRTTPLPNAIA